jgi:hypothetical protein
MSDAHPIASNGFRLTGCARADRVLRGEAELLAEATMEIFVHQQNLLFFRKLLAEPQDEERRLRLIKLLAEEEAKNQNSRQSDKPAGE